MAPGSVAAPLLCVRAWGHPWAPCGSPHLYTSYLIPGGLLFCRNISGGM